MSGKMIALESSEASSHCLQSISPTDPESHRGNWGDLGSKLQVLRQQQARPAWTRRCWRYLGFSLTLFVVSEAAGASRFGVVYSGGPGPTAAELLNGPLRQVPDPQVLGWAGRCHPISIDPS